MMNLLVEGVCLTPYSRTHLPEITFPDQWESESFLHSELLCVIATAGRPFSETCLHRQVGYRGRYLNMSTTFSFILLTCDV